jgi:AcrR family transcriptional regulator
MGDADAWLGVSVRRHCRERQVKATRKSGWQRDPEGTRRRILEAATKEFARYGFSGARIDRVAEGAGINKRMLYYHVGNKEALYLEVLEGSYEHIRAAERQLNLKKLAPIEALSRLMEFTWHYYLEHPEFMALLNTENLHRAQFLKKSRKVKQLHSPFVALIADILRRGEAEGSVRPGIDPVQLYISIASLSYFYLSNNRTLSVIFGTDLLDSEAKKARLVHMADLLAAALRPTAQPQINPAVRKSLLKLTNR